MTYARIEGSSALVDFDGQIFLLNIGFSERFDYHNAELSGITLESLAHVDAVVVSHGHCNR